MYNATVDNIPNDTTLLIWKVENISCPDADTMHLIKKPTLEFASLPNDTTLLAGESITLSVETTGIINEYKWQIRYNYIHNNEKYSGTYSPELTIYNIQPEDADRYRLNIYGPCSSASSSFIYLSVLNEIDEDHNIKYNVYPNPSSGVFNIDHNKGEVMNVKLLDVFGKVLFSDVRVQDGMIDLSGHPSGVYILKISDGKGIFYKKIILN